MQRPAGRALDLELAGQSIYVQAWKEISRAWSIRLPPHRQFIKAWSLREQRYRSFHRRVRAAWYAHSMCGLENLYGHSTQSPGREKWGTRLGKATPGKTVREQMCGPQ